MLVLLYGLVILAIFSKALAASHESTYAQTRAGFQHVVIRIDHDPVRLGTPESIDLELLRGSRHQDFLVSRISFRVHADFNRHAKRIEILVNLSHNFEPFSGPIYDELQLKFRNACRIHPLRKKRNEITGGSPFFPGGTFAIAIFSNSATVAF